VTFLSFLAFLQKKILVRNAESSIIAVMKRRKKNLSLLKMTPNFSNCQLSQLFGFFLYNSKKAPQVFCEKFDAV
jgi:hypothetical protein